MRPFLIYTSAGEHNNVHRWIGGEDRNYDIWVTNYSEKPGLLSELADYYNEKKGAKFQNFHNVFECHRDHLEQYQAIMVADDDIIIPPKKLEGLFAQLVKENLWIITPAFSRFGKITHDTTERRLASQYRYTNFCEMTCPIFDTRKLLDFMEIYDPDLPAYGVDWWYLNFINDASQRRIVISDEFYCVNPRDIQKSTVIREIDKHSSSEVRREKWIEFKERHGIESFEKKTFLSEPAPIHRILTSFPLYLVEVIFDKLVRWRALSLIRRVVKRVIKKWRPS